MTASHPELTTDQFAAKIFDVVRGAASAQALYLGDRLGWYRTLADHGPSTATELAERSGTDARYAREWLEQQVVSGVLTADLAHDPVRFELPRAHAAVLVDTESTSFMLPLARLFAATGVRLPDLVQAYRTGGGVSWAQLGVDAREAQGAMNRPVFSTQLTIELLPLVPDLHQLLTAGGRVADIGCGEGWASIALAVGYPSLHVHGIDVDAPSIAAAARNASERGVADRVTFDVADAAELRDAAYDAVFAFECIHDLPDPVGVLAAMRRIAEPGAPVIVMDERTADVFTPDAGPVEELLYGYSILCCLPDGKSHENTVATGTVMRASTLDTYARSAGFDGASVLPIDHEFFRFYRLQ
ncbi:SAM-dependent methyltransferase [Rhodococcoides trifolii]|uniref:SAM-dependent methyltransferase n=1 Tax=Rhodococcoides trifolii TaxID=908250 RepID=A0A917FWW9_9NOCA|nr:class I SAM-dependent methyltransferase [Rhodococcus trifolii]GGG09787.1 SAM-dependent methyltransferase [Rhodococcus trifolii]